MLENPDIENKQKNKQKQIIETTSLKEVNQMIQSTIQKNEWLAVLGESGTGKNQSLNYSLQNYNTNKYIKVNYEGVLYSYKDLTNSIMSECIRNMLPGEKPARDVFARYTQFKRALIETKQQGKKLILVVNEAQRLNQETMYGIKMLHEAGQDYYNEHLFAVVMVGQLALKRKIVAHELNFRIRRYRMQLLNKNEIKAMLNANGYTCNGSVLDSIASNSLHTPLGVYNFMIRIQDELNIQSGNLDIEQIYNLNDYSIKERMQKIGMSNQDGADSASAVLGKHITASTVSKVKHNNLNSPVADALRTHWQEIEAHHLSQKKPEPQVESNMA